jgi:cyanate permease
MLPDRLIATGSGIMSGTANLFSAATPFVMGFLIQVSGSYLGGLFFLVAMAVLGLLSSVILFRQGY